MSIFLLGEFLVLDEETPVTTLHAPRLQTLLALLLLRHDIPQSRQHVAFCLWPDSSETQAKANLRNLLHQLRHLLPAANDFLVTNGRTVFWCDHDSCSCDVATFLQALARANQAAQYGDQAEVQAGLEEAIVCYRGDLLPMCYDDWILPEREHLRQLFVGALERLATMLEEQREYQAAIPYTERLIKIEPLKESNYLQLMRLHTLNNDRAAALKTYQICTDILQRELALKPDDSLRNACEQLLINRPGSPYEPKPHLVGRRRAWGQLLQCWERAVGGNAHLVVLVGEAGVGKTHLADELIRWAEQQGFRTATARCYPGSIDFVFAPVIAWLRSPVIYSILPTFSSAWLTELVCLLPELRDARPDLPPGCQPTKIWQRQHLFEALLTVVCSGRKPLLLFVDDLQWSDDASLDWLCYLLHKEVLAPLMLLATLRPEELEAVHPVRSVLTYLQGRGRAITMNLGPLDQTETMGLAEQLVGHTLTQEQQRAIYEETEGNPLFVVEIVRAWYAQQGASARGAGDTVSEPTVACLPSGIQAVIAERLARLSQPAHELLSVAATVGRVFTLPILAGVLSHQNEAALVCSLEELERRRIIREHDGSSYAFSYEMLRKVAYGQLSAARRRMLHIQVAEAMELLCDNQRDGVGAQQAAHYEAAHCVQRAVRAYQHAAAGAQRGGALVEAARYYRHALRLLGSTDDLPPPCHTVELEVDLNASLGDVLLLAGEHEQARTVYGRALHQAPETNSLMLARLHRSIGNSWRLQAQFVQAGHAYRQALAALGTCRERAESGYWHEAIALYNDYLTLRLCEGRSATIAAEELVRFDEVLER